jgi:glycosyltransferase involved in cell wall biosynthesis
MLREGLSVIVCCYNSALRLPETLKHLAGQIIPDEIQWELILVNNASTDNTVEVAEKEWGKYHLGRADFHILYEEKPGLSHARAKGIGFSRFNYIIFCDDDNWLSEDYLRIAYQTLVADPQIAALGGKSTAVSTRALPAWFESSKSNYAVGEQAPVAGDISYRKHLWGSGIALRKAIYLQAFSNFPSILSGRKGKVLSSGEDSEMCMRFLLLGYRLFYTDALFFKHFIQEDRLNEIYNQQLVEGFIAAHQTLSIYSWFVDAQQLSFQRKLRLLIKATARLLITATTPIKRWDIEIDKRLIYMIAGIRFRNTDKNLINIRQLQKRRYLKTNE